MLRAIDYPCLGFSIYAFCFLLAHLKCVVFKEDPGFWPVSDSCLNLSKYEFVYYRIQYSKDNRDRAKAISAVKIIPQVSFLPFYSWKSFILGKIVAITRAEFRKYFSHLKYYLENCVAPKEEENVNKEGKIFFLDKVLPGNIILWRATYFRDCLETIFSCFYNVWMENHFCLFAHPLSKFWL